MIGTALAILGGAATAIGAHRVCTKGVAIEEKQIGAPGLGPKWRIRWACWRWKAEVWSARNGWQPVGDYKTPELAKGAAITAALKYAPQPAIGGATATATADEPILATRTSFKTQDV